MSFYGSVYYQLIDTFYKITAKNILGEENSNFPESLSDVESIQAFGRKGELNLTNGNKWINFTSDGNGFVVWHGKPDAENAIEVSGINFEGTKDEADQMPDIKILQPGDCISATDLKYDEAGHIVPEATNKTYFQLPISETEKDLTDIKETIGVPAEGGNEASGLMLTQEQNNKLYNFYNGDFSKVLSLHSIKPFPEAFGSIDNLRKDFAGSSASNLTVSEILSNFKETTDSSITTINEAIKSLDSRLAALENQ